MRTSSTRLILPALLVLAASVSACSKGTSGSPVAPSASSAASTTTGPVPASTGASISGMVVTGSSPALAATAPFALQGVAGAGRVTVSVNGTSIATISDDRGAFTLQNVPPGTITLTITGTGFSAPVTLPAVNTNDQLTVTVRVNGNSATLDDQELESPDDKAEIEGVITAVNGNTITVGRLAKQVVVPATASITKGGATRPFADLVVGVRVHVRATRTGSTLTATTVIIQTDNPGSNGAPSSSDDSNHDSPDTSELSFSGTLAAAASGTCPAISFTVGGTKVKTSASTKFDNATCATFLSLPSGTSVKGEGTKQSDGSVLASEVEAPSSSDSGKKGK